MGSGTVVVSADLVEWAERIAVRWARGYRLRGQERDDLKSTAVLVVVELAARPVAAGGFDTAGLAPGSDPLDAFKGWANLFVKNACEREAKRLRGGGTFNTCRPGNEVEADPLGDSSEAVTVEAPTLTVNTDHVWYPPDPRDKPDPEDNVDGPPLAWVDAVTTTGELYDLKPSAYGRTFGRPLRSV